MMYQVLLVLAACVCCSVQQPPGIPPHDVNVAPPGGHADVRGHQDGFGVNPHDAEHIKEHLKEVVDKPKEAMTDEELEFHYFKLHDYDSNNKLDGTEITKAITHLHDDEESSDEEKKAYEAKVFSDDEIANIVDMVLREDDLNKDGYIEYVEFVTAQRKARSDNNV